MVKTGFLGAETSFDFWKTVGPPLLVIPVALLAAIALIDLFRRVDLSPRARAGWALAIVLLPLIGSISYLLKRPSATEFAQTVPETASADDQELQRSSPADQLRMLALLHDAGKLTDSEFAAAKVRVLRDDGAMIAL